MSNVQGDSWQGESHESPTVRTWRLNGTLGQPVSGGEDKRPNDEDGDDCSEQEREGQYGHDCYTRLLELISYSIPWLCVWPRSRRGRYYVLVVSIPKDLHGN